MALSGLYYSGQIASRSRNQAGIRGKTITLPVFTTKDYPAETLRTELVKSARLRMARLCSRREYCRAEIGAKLRDYGLFDDECAEVLEALQAAGYVDDKRYARSYAGDRFRLHRWGRRKIRYELIGRGIPEDLAMAAVEGIGEDEYLETIRYLASKKLSLVPHAESRVLKHKVVQYLIRKGFEPEIVQPVVEQTINQAQA